RAAALGRDPDPRGTRGGRRPGPARPLPRSGHRDLQPRGRSAARAEGRCEVRLTLMTPRHSADVGGVAVFQGGSHLWWSVRVDSADGSSAAEGSAAGSASRTCGPALGGRSDRASVRSGIGNSLTPFSLSTGQAFGNGDTSRTSTRSCRGLRVPPRGREVCHDRSQDECRRIGLQRGGEAAGGGGARRAGRLAEPAAGGRDARRVAAPLLPARSAGAGGAAGGLREPTPRGTSGPRGGTARGAQGAGTAQAGAGARPGRATAD